MKTKTKAQFIVPTLIFLLASILFTVYLTHVSREKITDKLEGDLSETFHETTLVQTESFYGQKDGDYLKIVYTPSLTEGILPKDFNGHLKINDTPQNRKILYDLSLHQGKYRLYVDDSKASSELKGITSFTDYSGNIHITKVTEVTEGNLENLFESELRKIEKANARVPILFILGLFICLGTVLFLFVHSRLTAMPWEYY